MTHRFAPASGMAWIADAGRAVRAIARCFVFAALMVAASSAANAQLVVSVTAADGTASEAGDSGQFLVQAAPTALQDTTITYSVSGSASPGADYTALSGSVTIAAGSTDASIPVNVPGADQLFEGEESVIITLEGSDDPTVTFAQNTATVTIADSAYAVTASAIANASEDPVSNGELRVSLDAENQSGAPLTVDYSVSGTASPGVDYQALSGTVNIPVGASFASIPVTPINDDTPDDGETVAVTLTNTSAAGVTVGSPANASITINDTDQPVDTEVMVSVSASDATAGETSGGNGEFLIRRTGNSTRQVTVNYTVGGTATPGADYTMLSGTVSLGDSVDEATVTVAVGGNDGVFEGDETVSITLLDVPGDVKVSGNGSATVTIQDSTHSVTVSRLANAAENPLAVGRLRVALGAQNQSGAGLTVQYSVAGTATPGVDYQGLSGSAVIAVGAGSVDIDVTPIDDDIEETPETVVITLTGTSNSDAPVGDPDTANVQISDGANGDNNEVMLSISAPDATAGETSGGTGQFLVSRVGGSNRAVTVNYAVTGSATPGDDYAALPGNVHLGQNDNQATIQINAAGNDNLFEGNETVTLRLLPVNGQISVANDTATVTISDSAHTVIATLVTNASENPPSPGEILASLGARNDSGSALSVSYSVSGTATPGTDYAALNGTTVIATGSTAASILITPLNDSLLEDPETVVVTLTATGDARAPVGNPASATVTIADDDSGNDDDGDGVGNAVECPGGSECPDTDQDGLPDYQDPDDDGDGAPTASEGAPSQDTDDDGIPDYLDDDDDGDGRPTASEDANEDGDGNPVTNPTDLDGDGIPDYLDADDTGGPAGDADGDGLSNDEEAQLGTDPQNPDTDGDGVGDGDEVAADTDPLDNRSFADADADFVPDAVEADDGTDPHDAASFADSDGGGTADHVETTIYAIYELAPTDTADPQDDRRDLDGDGLPDRLEIVEGSDPTDAGSPTANGGADDDSDGVSNAIESWLATLGINSVDAISDLDRDIYPDAGEVKLGLNPLRASERDSDGEGVPDIIEALAGLDIDAATDSDGDGVPDARELALGFDFLDANLPVANGGLDDDGDGVSNAIESVLRLLGASDDTDETTDSDDDGIGDADEIRSGTDPLHDEQPVPWIELRQEGVGGVNAVVAGSGPAMATAIIGGHQTGTISYDWGDSDNAILAVSSGGQANKTLTFAPQTLPAGNYVLAVTVQRSVAGAASSASVVEFPLLVLSGGQADSVADADSDGIPDSADDADARSGFANELATRSGGFIHADAGVRLQLGSTARGARVTSARVTTADIANAGDGNGGSVGNSEDGFDYPGGIYDFDVTNLPEVGSVVRVVIPQTTPIGEFPEYRKFQPNSGWSGFVENANNKIESAAGSSAGCPEPGDNSYAAGLTPGHFCVQLSIEDGGPNDSDAALGPNGIIKDPGGVATPQGEVSVGSGGGSTAPVALGALGLFALLGALRRRLLDRGHTSSS